SIEREFTFDVTFTRIAEGDSAFDTLALVDGGVVAREADRFSDGDGVAPIPVPAGLPLLLTALGGIGYISRRRKAA
ncbi:MAG: VPLPA-CTERM sorting domain-containing protein, partial [Pseudomonadota bacterium]